MGSLVSYKEDITEPITIGVIWNYKSTNNQIHANIEKLV